MKSSVDDKNKDLKLPKDIPDSFFDVVSKVLNFVENVDKDKNK